MREPECGISECRFPRLFMYKSFKLAKSGILIAIKLKVMNDDGKNRKEDELLNRRQFFKKAGKGVLPILGAIALSNIPILGNAINHEGEAELGCNLGCSNGCYNSCYTTCRLMCSGSCRGGCQGQCTGACARSCSGSCSGSCSYSSTGSIW